ncbi:MAG: response regulator [Candidatus Buchananbacteria bacterium]|nr:response regulator [Candidatus Buchananbacteria bacterium]
MTQKPIVFLVEDDLDVLEIEKSSLLDKCQVLTATNLDEAVVGILQSKDQIDLLVLDIKLDNNAKAGLQLAKFLRATTDLSKYPEAKQTEYPNFQGKILVSTVDLSIALAKVFEDLNIIGAILKPFAIQNFQQAIETSLQIDSAELVLESGERVLYEWGSEKMRRQMVIDTEGNVYKTGYWTRGGILSVCLPIVTGYCSIGCCFCSHAYAPKGSTRKRTVEEIKNSVKIVLQGTLFQPPLEEGEKFDIAFTGEGEPGKNLDNTIEAIHQLSREYGDQIRRVMVSTVKTKVIKRLLQENFVVPVQLQISGFFWYEERKQYMKGADPLEELLELAFQYWQKTGRKLPIILNHALIAKQTDTEKKIKQLIKLIKKAGQQNTNWLKVKISNYNPITNIDWQASGGQAMMIKKLFADQKIFSFFYRIPRRQIERIPDK